jgi:hypothetical protein
MSKYQLTASQLERARHCVWWLQDDVVWRKTTSDAANFGSEVHKLIENYLRGSTDKPDLTTKAGMRFEIWRKWWLLHKQQQKEITILGIEQAFAYNTISKVAEAIEIIDRNYPHNEELGWVYGTADLVYRTDDGHVWVWDWKTGSMPVSSRSTQLCALAAFASSLYGCEDVHPAVAQITDDGVFENSHYMQFFDIQDTGNLLVDLYEKAFIKKEPTPCAGNWCTFCPVVTDCPETARLLGQIGAVDIGHKYLPVIQDKEHAAWLVHRSGVLRDVQSQVNDALKEYVDDNGPIDVGDGYSYTGFGKGLGKLKYKMYKLTKKV